MHPVIFFLLSVLLSLVPMMVSAGDIDSPGPPSAGSGVYTIEDIYNYLADGTGPTISSTFREPTAGPGPTMKSTKDIYDDVKAKFDQCNATPDQVMDTVKFFSTDAGNWGPRSGSLTTKTLSEATTTVEAGYYDATTLNAVDPDLATGNIKKDVNIFGVAGDPNVVNTSSGDAAAGEILNSKKAWVDGSEVTGSLICPPAPTGDAATGDVLSGKTFSNSSGTGLTGTMTNNGGGGTITPGTSDQTVDAGYWSSANTVSGDADLVTGNIRAGTTIFGVTGKTEVVDTTEATNPVVAGRMKTGDVAFVNGSKVTGTGTKTLSAASDTVAEGYYAATTLSEVDTDLVAGNIKCGKTIFGVTGTLPPGCVAKTGQTTCYSAAGGVIGCAGTGQDGEYQMGCDPVVVPSPGIDFGGYNRTSFPCSSGFTDNGDGTVTDNLTGLIWLKNAACFGPRTWAQALSDCNGLASGSCGLTDSSSAGDWRLPNINELRSLFDPNLGSPYLPAGHPFTNVQSTIYWSSTTYASYTFGAWGVGMGGGSGSTGVKGNVYYVWPVRSGN